MKRQIKVSALREAATEKINDIEATKKETRLQLAEKEIKWNNAFVKNWPTVARVFRMQPKSPEDADLGWDACSIQCYCWRQLQICETAVKMIDGMNDDDVVEIDGDEYSNIFA